MTEFLMGAVAAGQAIAGLFFLRYWRETHDRFFACFAIAFFVLAGNRVLLALLDQTSETSLAPYLVRLVAYVMILAAIMDKNFRRF